MLEVVQTTTPSVTRPQSDAALEGALERLLLCNQVRELADYAAPVTIAQIPSTRGWVVSMVRRVYRSGNGRGSRTGAWSLFRRVLLDVCTLLWLRMLLGRGKVWRIARTTAGAAGRSLVFHAMRYHARPSSDMTGYVNASDKEEPLIRVCLFLRTMKRYGACIDFLLQRLHSGLPAEQTRQWLAFFLREVGDRQAAAQLSSACPGKEMPGWLDRIGSVTPAEVGSSPWSRSKSGIAFGIVMPAMFDSEVFHRSLLSLLESDFQGQIVVVEDGYQPTRACESFCRQLPVTYIKNPRWTGPSASVNLGIEQLQPDTDVILYSHSDVLWPPHWFRSLDHAWEIVYASGKVGILNLSYLQFHAQSDAVLTELFMRGRYEDLLWVLRTRRGVQPPMDYVQHVENTDPGRLFGLGRDNWGDDPAKLRLMTGKFSIGASFPLETWRDLGGFDPDMPFGLDMELHYRNSVNRKWNLWVNNTPLIHLVSSDTSKLAGPDKARFGEMDRKTYEGFARKTGWSVDHFYWTYFAETCVIYHDEIVEAANALRFSDIERVFDDLFERLKRKTLSSCELVWCRSRAVCPYV